MHVRRIGLALLLLGCSQTTPGGTVDAGPDADTCTGPAIADRHCTDSEFWKCRRDQFAGRITEAMFNECLTPIAARCASAAWPAGCSPGCAQSAACLTLLSAIEYADVPTAELLATYPDCDLCP